jgi:hypothetical protein
MRNGEINSLSFFLKKIITVIYTIGGKIRPEFEEARLTRTKQDEFAPIYDSGCSFGRELKDEKVTLMLGTPSLIEKYVEDGMSEIHWNQNKVSHFELLQNALTVEPMKKHILVSLQKVINNFNKTEIEKIVRNIDEPLIKSNNPNFFPKERKELVLELLNLRLSKLREIHSQHT